MVGILAFGSLIDDPGTELRSVTVEKRLVQTPFPVEYARFSESRAGAPTLVPVENGGASVKATLLVLRGDVTLENGKNILWRRETKQVGSGKPFRERKRPTAKTVLIQQLASLDGVDEVLYVDFTHDGKLQAPTASELALAAVKSASTLSNDEDGITYLRHVKESGIETPLTASYERAVLDLTRARTLEEAREKVRAG